MVPTTPLVQLQILPFVLLSPTTIPKHSSFLPVLTSCSPYISLSFAAINNKIKVFLPSALNIIFNHFFKIKMVDLNILDFNIQADIMFFVEIVQQIWRLLFGTYIRFVARTEAFCDTISQQLLLLNKQSSSFCWIS